MKLLNLRLGLDQHSFLLDYCSGKGISIRNLLEDYIDSLLSGESDPLCHEKLKGGYDNQGERHTVLRRAPNGYRKVRDRRTTDRDPTDLSCAHCGEVFLHISSVVNHEKHCKGDVDRTLAHKKWWAKTRWLRNNVKTDKLGNRVEMRLSFDEYCMLLSQAGITAHDIGVNEKHYCLGRYRDIGHYEIGNCRFVSVRTNMLESHYSELLIKLGKDPTKISLTEYETGLDSFMNSVESAVSAV